MNYENAENEIAERLEGIDDIRSVADIMLLPDAVANYDTPVNKCLITVAFLSEKFDKNQSIGEVSQHTTVSFIISIQARRLRGNNGVYAVSELVKRGVEGLILKDGGRLTLVEQEFSNYQNDVWEHSLTVSCKSLRAENKQQLLPSDKVTDDEVFYTPHNTTVNETIL